MSEHNSSQKSANPNIQLHLENLSRTYRDRMRRHRASATYQRPREGTFTRDVTSAQPERRTSRLRSTSSSTMEPPIQMASSAQEERRKPLASTSSVSSQILETSPLVEKGRHSKTENEVKNGIASESRPALKASVKWRKISAQFSKAHAQSEGSSFRKPPMKVGIG